MPTDLNIKPQFKKKTIRSFVIRAGRMTEGQKLAFSQYWPTYGLDLFAGKLCPSEIFGRSAPIILEIGFGMGDSLIQMAINEPDKDFIGIEVHQPGVGRIINTAGLAELKNLRIFMADATDVLDDCIPDNCIDRLQIFFPDPWHKVKHKKRRIVQEVFVEKIRHKLKQNGVLHLATDWEDYAKYMLKVMQAAPGYKNCSVQSAYSPQPDYRPTTKFEKRGERLGHGVWDLLFSRTD